MVKVAVLVTVAIVVTALAVIYLVVENNKPMRCRSPYSLEYCAANQDRF